MLSHYPEAVGICLHHDVDQRVQLWRVEWYFSLGSVQLQTVIFPAPCFTVSLIHCGFILSACLLTYTPLYCHKAQTKIDQSGLFPCHPLWNTVCLYSCFLYYLCQGGSVFVLSVSPTISRITHKLMNGLLQNMKLSVGWCYSSFLLGLCCCIARWTVDLLIVGSIDCALVNLHNLYKAYELQPLPPLETFDLVWIEVFTCAPKPQDQGRMWVR